MYANLHTLPAGQSLYTIAVTDAPVDTDREDYYIVDEIDVVAQSYATAAQVVKVAREEGLFADLDGGLRVIGVADQSTGDVVWEDWEGLQE